MATNNGRVTLRDIARQAGVSTATVSRVFNEYPFVDESTRDAVRSAARALGYPIETSRRNLPPARFVLLLTRARLEQSSLGNPLFGGMLEHLLSAGAQPVLAQQGINLRLETTYMAPEEAPQYAAEAGVAGLLMSGGVQDHAFLRRLQGLRVPFVVAAAPLYALPVNFVSPDYARGSENAVAHLADAGRRSIGIVNGPPATASSDEKLRGYRLGLALSGLAYDERLVVVAEEFDPDSGRAATARLLARAPEVDAILYAGDELAFGGLRCLKDAGRRVPQDVAAIGYMDYEIARFCEPPLTTVRVDLPRVGAIAARRLADLLERPDDDAWHVYVPVQLVIRGSA